MWDAAQYLKYSDERGRPFADLLGQVRRARAASIVDLGCGAGNLTRTLCDRWPMATVTGVDSSPQMLAQARQFALSGKLDFVEGDIAHWQPAAPVDLLVSNAALQWIDDHERLLERLAAMLAPGGTLAVQMPNRFENPSQQAIEEARVASVKLRTFDFGSSPGLVGLGGLRDLSRVSQGRSASLTR